MLKTLRIAVTALGLMACVLLVALWVRSYWRTDGLYWNVYHHRSVLVGSIQGQIVVYSDLMTIGSSGRVKLLNEMHVGMTPIPSIASGIRSTSIGGRVGPYGHHVVFPHWAPMLMTVALATVPWVHWSRRFSLRTLLIATTLVAVGMGTVIYLTR
jgi:hypothetical protein